MTRTPENIGHLYQFKIGTVKPGLTKKGREKGRV